MTTRCARDDQEDPEHPAPFSGAPGRAGQEKQLSESPREGNAGVELRPSPQPGKTPPTAHPEGQGGAPSGADHADAESRPSPAAPPSSAGTTVP
jgi:hypothetical protein